MIRFVLRRLLIMVPLVLLVLTITFFMVSLAPGSPFSKERKLPPEIEANLNAKYGFDQSRWKQYTRFMGRILGFTYDTETKSYSWRPYPDFGDSTKYRDRRVNDIILEALPVSIVLGLTAYLIALALGLTTGVLSSLKPNSLLDYTTMSSAMMGVSIPNFVLGPLLVIIFSLTIYWFPPARMEWALEWGYLRIPTLKTMVLPALTLAALYVAYIARMTRSGMLETLRQDYIRTARAKGLSERRVVLGHALRGGLLPVVSFTGPALAFLISGTIVVETIFSVPGLGRYFIDAANNRDHFLLLGITAFVAVSLMIFNLLVDIAYAWIDPRIRYE
ncbi:MAG TPA: ABC transporter permease subunit [Blastocatellia bacterium]|nr:ABC transporter permease subunit [Blastocatellia bacterium]